MKKALLTLLLLTTLSQANDLTSTEVIRVYVCDKKIVITSQTVEGVRYIAHRNSQSGDFTFTTKNPTWTTEDTGWKTFGKNCYQRLIVHSR